MATLEVFEREVGDGRGCVAPNGVWYKVIQDSQARPVVERIYCGFREEIVGTERGRFATGIEAGVWAVGDGRLEWGPGLPRSQRRQLC